MLYSITKSGPCITSSSRKPTNVYLLQDIWPCRPVVRSRDIRALISFAEAGSILPELRGHGISISDPIFLFFPRAPLHYHSWQKCDMMYEASPDVSVCVCVELDIIEGLI